MKIFAVLATTACLAAPAAMADELDAHKKEAAGIIQAFFGEMKGELEAGMKSGGPVKAIGICNEKAPRIASAHAARSGWDVGRTSARLRNPGNEPDAWEKTVLADFEARKAAGEKPDTLVSAVILEENGGRTFRFMKAIPTGEVCLTCHGQDLKPEVATKLGELYPTDQARGHSLNDLRGAFTLSKRL